MGFVTNTVTTVTLTCDGPKCANHNESGKPSQLTWIDEEAKKDPNSIPDDFFRWISMGTPKGAQLCFCGQRCSRDALNVYVPPLSPRELQAQLEQNAKVAAEKHGAPAIDPAVAVGGVPVQKTDDVEVAG